ncbi:hypothetical protein ACFO5Q_05675 [Kordiimonas lipolytica]|uniref:SMP-30/Gluconolactonase/LRE-like region domain-containing protein n=1 Tax=Kordiimonas lipolytica TaxID=1662421 RepID=A0ABV8U7Z8_9PROT|nr:hypothetical protein [Kordiimonas lipolytica]
MKKKILIGSGVLVVAVVGFVLNTLMAAGTFRKINPHYHGKCDAVTGVVGVEDITIDPDSGFAYLSSHDRRTWAKTGEAEGDIFLYRPGSLATPLAMPHDYEGSFHPHGISLWLDATGPDRLMVVNHPNSADAGGMPLSQVEIFEVGPARLTHIRTVKTDGPYSLNDVVATGPETFYASIDKGSETKLGRSLESYLRLSRGGIAYGDEHGMRRVEGGLVYPNGIQWDGVHLYVAETTGRRLLKFKPSETPMELTLVAEDNLNTALDNLEWDADGNLWIGAHPQTLKFVEHAKDAANRSPSQVLKATLADGGFDLQEVYLNDGDPISGSSVAAPYAGRMLIGSVFDPFILDCKL